LDPIAVGVAGIALVFLLLLAGMPIAYTMFFVGLLGMSCLRSVDAALPFLANSLYATVSSYPFMVLPLFIVMGSLAESAGMTRNLYSAFEKWLRPFRGGIAIASIGASAGFAAVSGSSVATAAAMGRVALPQMERLGYHPRLSTASIAAGGTLGFLIPPSIGFVVYGTLTEQSVGKLLLAGLVPGLLLAFAYSVTVLVLVRLDPILAPVVDMKVSWTERLSALGKVYDTVIVFVVAVGGIYSGLFTPTEAGAVGATLLLVVALAKRKLRWKHLFQSLEDTVRISVMVFLLVAGAGFFSRFLALSTIPRTLASFVGDMALPPTAILAILVLLYLVLGCFLDAISMMVLTMPVVFPVVAGLGYSPIWFGVIVVLMMEAGLITPPVGLNIFIVEGVTKTVLTRHVPAETIFRGVWPFLVAILFVATLITVWPNLALFLPDLMTR